MRQDGCQETMGVLMCPAVELGRHPCLSPAEGAEQGRGLAEAGKILSSWAVSAPSGAGPG